MHIVFAIMPSDEIIDSKRNQTMINYRADNLEEFILDSKNKNIKVDSIHQGSDAEGIVMIQMVTE